MKLLSNEQINILADTALAQIIVFNGSGVSDKDKHLIAADATLRLSNLLSEIHGNLKVNAYTKCEQPNSN